MNVLCRLAVISLLCGSTQANAADTPDLIASLKQGGYVLVFRHTATDDSQKDVYPFKFDDMSAQRQLSGKGRDMARQIGTSIRELAIPIGDVYTSRLNRAIEAGKLISGREVKPVEALTDSSNASASGMANPTGANAKAGQGGGAPYASSSMRLRRPAPTRSSLRTRPTSPMPSARTPATCRKAKPSPTGQVPPVRRLSWGASSLPIGARRQASDGWSKSDIPAGAPCGRPGEALSSRFCD
ncbi:histidine phosphatase family protein [Bradyrhizobium sp. LM2.9]